jgi:flagellar assembly protein FliH
MSTSLARRPRFLAEVPEISTPAPVRFAHASQPAPGSRHPAPLAEPVPAARVEGDESLGLAAIRREAMQKVAAAVETLRAQADRLAEQARSDAIEIGFQVARKVLEAELRQSPEALFALVRSAVRRAGESRRIAVRLTPEDAALLEADAGRAALDGITSARVEFVHDPGLQRGDCMVDADFGQVDGRLATRLTEIRRAVDAAGEGAA